MSNARMFYGAVRVVSFLTLLSLHVQAQVNIILFPNQVSMLDTTTQRKEIATVVCTNPSDNDICLCDLNNKGNDLFEVRKKGSNSDFHVDYVGVASGGKLTNTTYVLAVQCSNATGQDKQSQNLVVHITVNQPPVFATKTANTTVTVPSNNGKPVYQVVASDNEKDPLTYSIKSTRPNVPYFTIDHTTGEITVLTTTILYTATESSVVVTVEVTDGYTTVDNFDLTVRLTGLNQRPDITNLPKTIRLPEDTVVGTVIINLSVDDQSLPNPDTHPMCTVVPPNNKFTFIQGAAHSLKIKLNSTLDYEHTPLYTISCSFSDGYLTSQNEVLTIIVDDVNEPPQFDAAAYYCNLEESDAGVSSCYLGLHDILSDPDGDVISNVGFFNEKNSDRFRFERATTRVTFNVDYDVDKKLMDTNITLQLRATDSQGASSQRPVYIKIYDANDNTCTFKSGTVKTFKVNQGTPLKILGKLSAIDDDLTSPNNLVTYEVLQALPQESLNFISAYSDGTVAYTGIIPEDSGPASYSLVVACKDGGIPQRSSEATVVVTYMPTTSTSTTTTTTTTTSTTTTATTPTTTSGEGLDTWDDPAFLGVFATLMCLLGLALLALLYLCVKCFKPGFLTSLGKGSRFQEFCCPNSKNNQVEPVDDYFVSRVRTNPDYKDDNWRIGDKFETGKEEEVPNPFERKSSVRLPKASPPQGFVF